MREDRPIIALDFPDQESVMKFLELFPRDEQLFVKIGMELFYSCGPKLITEMTDRGYDVFLDLKCHDIPHTVEAALRSISKLNVTLTTVHASGGLQMMQAAKRGLAATGSKAKIVAITQLTSTSEEMIQQEQLAPVTMAESVSHYAQLAEQAGLDGVVCSAFEAQQIKEVTNNDFLTVTPGIRLKTDSHDDQQRVMTPDQAAQAGAAMIVVGRSITQAADPYQAYCEVKRLWKEGQN
ncbi:orotidine 5'-phosphate decarboxylase [Ligilactobacillus pabuli]|uniref:Orotidine 5'-phosphate decarboxylase n=1 Tax=Ligilactobacillus pabuli TaxID=2886039 RepID=A0ABQ5JEA8_9LACO|nr:orotidine-5'-phosphate decarboxylase [Ligilactobacillus pabuli]GKS80404.1 orotidine 5'-phosphate decarboxylase [Ligilactobacillus pabuli]